MNYFIFLHQTPLTRVFHRAISNRKPWNHLYILEIFFTCIHAGLPVFLFSSDIHKHIPFWYFSDFLKSSDTFNTYVWYTDHIIITSTRTFIQMISEITLSYMKKGLNSFSYLLKYKKTDILKPCFEIVLRFHSLMRSVDASNITECNLCSIFRVFTLICIFFQLFHCYWKAHSSSFKLLFLTIL